MKFGKNQSVINLHKKINEDRYTKHEPILLEINNSLFKDGILKKEFYQHFQNNYSDLSFFVQTLRSAYTKEYGFFLVNEKFLDTSKELLQNKNVLEVGAGTGFLSKCLLEQQINITPIDLKVNNNLYGFENKYCDILEIDAIKYLKNNFGKHDTIIMSWPNYDNDFAKNVLKQLKSGQTLIYIGESYGGCTANDKFFELLESKAILDLPTTEAFQSGSVSWPGIHDKVYAYKIK